MEDLDRRIAATYGVTVDSSEWLSAGARPERIVLAADELARTIGDRPAAVPPDDEPVWPTFPPPPVPPATAAARRAAIARLLSWAADRGVWHEPLDFTVDDDGACTARARRDLAAGERVLVIPRTAMILHDALEATATGAVDAFGPQLEHGSTTLAVWLALEHDRADSPWRSYLDTLPARLDELPCYRRGDDVDELRGTMARFFCATAGKRLVDLRELLRPELRDRIPLPRYGWACATVTARGYRVTIGGRDHYALIPISDLLDHRPGDTQWVFDDEADAMIYTALRPLPAGAIVHARYGGLGNARLLHSYGFTLDDNPDDEAGLVFGPAPSVRVALTAHMLWRVPLAGPTLLPVTREVDAHLTRALSLARLRAAGLGELLAALGAGGLVRGEIGWLGPEVERAALAEVAAAARAGLARLADHPAADPAWGADPDRTAWQRACARIRRGERAVLEDVHAFALAAADDLATAEPAALAARAAAIAADAPAAERMRRVYLQAIVTGLEAEAEPEAEPEPEPAPPAAAAPAPHPA